MIRRQQDFWASMATLRGKFASQTQKSNLRGIRVEYLPTKYMTLGPSPGRPAASYHLNDLDTDNGSYLVAAVSLAATFKRGRNVIDSMKRTLVSKLARHLLLMKLLLYPKVKGI